jgi:hypothetical protein
MITRTTELKSGKSIISYDDIISMEHRSALYKNIVNSSFKIGWEDNAAIENSSHKYLYHQYEREDFFKLGILLYLAKTPALAHFDGKKLRRAVLNLSTPSDVYFPHTHKNQDVLLY